MPIPFMILVSHLAMLFEPDQWILHLENALDADISDTTLKRAKHDLGVKSKKEGDGSWTWYLPAAKETKGDDPSNVDPLDPLGKVASLDLLDHLDSEEDTRSLN